MRPPVCGVDVILRLRKLDISRWLRGMRVRGIRGDVREQQPLLPLLPPCCPQLLSLSQIAVVVCLLPLVLLLPLLLLTERTRDSPRSLRLGGVTVRVCSLRGVTVSGAA